MLSCELLGMEPAVLQVLISSGSYVSRRRLRIACAFSGLQRVPMYRPEQSNLTAVYRCALRLFSSFSGSDGFDYWYMFSWHKGAN